jgi:hypothetical protein
MGCVPAGPSMILRVIIKENTYDRVRNVTML